MRKLRLIDNIHFTAERRRLYNVARGNDGLFYIATYGNGLFVYDYPTGKLRHFTAGDPQPIIDTNVLKDIMVGNDGTVWVAQENAGVVRITVTPQPVASLIQPAPNHNGDWANYIGMIAQIKGKGVLFSTRDNRLYSLDTATGSVKPLSRMNSCAFSAITDSRGREWIATRYDGLYVDGEHYDKASKERSIPSRISLTALWRTQGGGYGSPQTRKGLSWRPPATTEASLSRRCSTAISTKAASTTWQSTATDGCG